MTIVTALPRALWIGLLGMLLGGCSSLPFFKDEAEPAEPREPEIALYEFEVDAPSERVRSPCRAAVTLRAARLAQSEQGKLHGACTAYGDRWPPRRRLHRCNTL